LTLICVTFDYYLTQKNPTVYHSRVIVFITISPIRILPSGIFVPASPPLSVAWLTNRAPCLWGHQNAATSAMETLCAVLIDLGATASLMAAAREVFTTHSDFGLGFS